MPEGEILSKQDRIEEALKTLQELGGLPRGDSFDIGAEGASSQGTNLDTNVLGGLLSNPQQFFGLDLSQKQRKNIRSAMVGGGAGLSHHFLSDMFGDEIAAVIGAGIAAWLAKKVVRRE